MVADLPRALPAPRRTLLPESPVARAAIVVAVAVPMILAALLVAAAAASAWMVWILIGWFVFGHHRPHRYYRYTRRGYGPRNAHRQGAGHGRGSWY